MLADMKEATIEPTSVSIFYACLCIQLTEDSDLYRLSSRGRVDGTLVEVVGLNRGQTAGTLTL